MNEINHERETTTPTPGGQLDRMVSKPLLLHGDCRDLLSISADAIITSPPYGVGKSYETKSYSEWLALMFSFFGMSEHILSFGGFVVVVISDVRCHPDPALKPIRAESKSRQKPPTTQDVIDAIRNGAGSKKELTQTLGCSEQTIDRRLKGNNARGEKKEYQTRIRLSAADMTQAAESAGLYLYDSRIWVKDPCWQTCQYHALSYRAVDEYEHILVYTRRTDVVTVERSRLEAGEWGSWGSRGVWRIPSVCSNNDHPAKYPIKLAERLVKLFCPIAGTVCDPFMGSGTTGVACVNTGRHFIGIELDEQYFKIAQERISAA